MYTLENFLSVQPSLFYSLPSRKMFAFNVAAYSTDSSDTESELSIAYDAPDLNGAELLNNFHDANEVEEWNINLATQPAAANININLQDIFDAETIAPFAVAPDLDTWFDGETYSVPAGMPQEYQLDSEFLATALNFVRRWGLMSPPVLPWWTFFIDLTDKNKSSINNLIKRFELTDRLRMCLAARSVLYFDYGTMRQKLLHPRRWHAELAFGEAGIYMSVMYDEVCRQRRNILSTEAQLNTVTTAIEDIGKTASSWKLLLEMFERFLCPEYHRAECAVLFVPELYNRILSYLPIVSIGSREQFLFKK